MNKDSIMIITRKDFLENKDLLEAWASGKQLQIRLKNTDFSWFDYTSDYINFNFRVYDFRIKPHEEKSN